MGLGEYEDCISLYKLEFIEALYNISMPTYLNNVDYRFLI